MKRTNGFIGSLVAVALALPLVAGAQGGSTTPSGEAVAKPAAQAPPAAPAQPATSAQPTAAAARSTASAGKAAASPASAARLDLNTATRGELEKLPGVGEAIADKIIAARPFTSRRQLLSKKLVTQAEYVKIAPHVIAKQPLASK